MKVAHLNKLGLSLIIWTAISTASAHERGPEKYLMAAMGDSITAGFFADSHIETIAIPDLSILPPFTNKKSDSWASGHSIYSHFLLLETSLHQAGDLTPIDVDNESVPGDKAGDMVAQAQKILKKMKKGHYQALKYVVLLIGANDACSDDTPLGTPEGTVRKGLEDTFDVLSQIQQAEPIRILMAGIPKIPDLGRPEVTKSKTVLGMTCSFFRDDFLQSCAPLLNWKSNEEYEKRVAVVEHFNQLLENIAHEANARHPNLQVVFTNQLYHTAIGPQLLALDCFHPSREGQQTISSALWADQPWFHASIQY
jgi:lysophospholipase L1-like esterase